MLCTEELHKALKRDIGTVKPLTEDSTAQHAACFLLQANLTKKTYFTAPSKEAELAAKEKFLAVNKANKSWSFPAETSIEYNIIMRAKNLLSSQFYDIDGIPKLSLVKAFNVGMVGKGSNVDATSADIWGKLFKSRLTTTSFSLYKLYKSTICNNDTWWNAETVRASQFGVCKLVSGSKMFYVPKDAKIARVAATEPTINMWGQLGYGKLIEKLLASYHDIDLSKQPTRNRWFAKSGSLNGEFGTIDLQSASDTIGLDFCKSFLPERMFQDLLKLRSPTTLVDGKEVTMEMISTMGNGFTFPLQTLIFASLVLATYLELGLKVRDLYGVRRYSVFGDDIIVEKSAYDTVCSVLTMAGFRVNDSKSYNTGKFRESCGEDYWSGIDVRAVYLQKCSLPAHIYSLYNRLTEWSAKHRISLRHTLGYLLTRAVYLPVPRYEEIDAGFRVWEDFVVDYPVDKYGNKYYFATEQVEFKLPVDETTIGLFYHGARISFLYGTIERHSITPRKNEDNRVYKVVKRRATLHWDLPYSHLALASEINKQLPYNVVRRRELLVGPFAVSS